MHVERESDTLRGVSSGISFNLANTDVTDTWGRVGVDVVHQFRDDLTLNLSSFASTKGYEATYSGSLGVQIQF